jgi:RNA polymerase sigma-70 factor (ECF subfamily)
MYSAATLEGLSPLSDEAIVSQVRDGHAAMFEVLMRRHNERLFRAARAILKDAAEAEDVMQQAYVNAYAHLRQFDGRASFATWLTRIAVNEALARARARGRYQSIDDEDAIAQSARAGSTRLARHAGTIVAAIVTAATAAPAPINTSGSAARIS